MAKVLDGHLAKAAWKEFRHPGKRQRIGFATPMRRDAAAVAGGGILAVGGVLTAAPVAAVAGLAIVWAATFDAFERGAGVRGRR